MSKRMKAKTDLDRMQAIERAIMETSKQVFEAHKNKVNHWCTHGCPRCLAGVEEVKQYNFKAQKVSEERIRSTQDGVRYNCGSEVKLTVYLVGTKYEFDQEFMLGDKCESIHNDTFMKVAMEVMSKSGPASSDIQKSIKSRRKSTSKKVNIERQENATKS